MPHSRQRTRQGRTSITCEPRLWHAGAVHIATAVQGIAIRGGADQLGPSVSLLAWPYGRRSSVPGAHDPPAWFIVPARKANWC